MRGVRQRIETPFPLALPQARLMGPCYPPLGEMGKEDPSRRPFLASRLGRGGVAAGGAALHREDAEGLGQGARAAARRTRLCRLHVFAFSIGWWTSVIFCHWAICLISPAPRNQHPGVQGVCRFGAAPLLSRPRARTLQWFAWRSTCSKMRSSRIRSLGDWPSLGPQPWLLSLKCRMA